MKNRIIFGVIFIILGILIALGPITIFPVCGIEPSQQMGHKSEQNTEQMSMGDKQQDSSKEKTTDCTIPKGKTMVMKCFWTARAELGIGIVIAILGLLQIVFPSVQRRQGLNISIILNGILALLVPRYLIGICNDVHASCRSLTLPALTIISSLLIIVALVNTIYLFKTDNNGQVKL